MPEVQIPLPFGVTLPTLPQPGYSRDYGRGQPRKTSQPKEEIDVNPNHPDGDKPDPKEGSLLA